MHFKKPDYIIGACGCPRLCNEISNKCSIMNKKLSCPTYSTKTFLDSQHQSNRNQQRLLPLRERLNEAFYGYLNNTPNNFLYNTNNYTATWNVKQKQQKNKCNDVLKHQHLRKYSYINNSFSSNQNTSIKSWRNESVETCSDTTKPPSKSYNFTGNDLDVF